MATYNPSNERNLLKEVVCPHCWHVFKPEDTLAIAESSDLYGDRKLGEMERTRFLPTEFDERGFPVDAGGLSCKDYACPNCHLRLPLGALEAPALFISIVGAPATGKSYYLSSSTHTLRNVLPSKFCINFTDADSEMNRRVREYEDLQFFSGDQLVQLEKTEESGDLYDTVKIRGQNMTFPQPFVFTAHPTADHPNYTRAETVARTLCLYDNAGESYLPTKDADSSATPVTRHLAHSNSIFFIFDPTQDARFRSVCREFSKDPQLLDLGKSSNVRRSPQRQEAVLNEMSKRVRLYKRMKNTERYQNPFVVIVGKYDVWSKLISYEHEKMIIKGMYKGRLYTFLNMTRVANLSKIVRDLLMKMTPEFVASVESFASNVVYIPVSSTGRSPELVETTEKNTKTCFRANQMKPKWSDVPMLYALAKCAEGLVPVLTPNESADKKQGENDADEDAKSASNISLTKK